MKAFLKEHGATDIELIAKIENQSGIDNIEDICQECSGIMIGRGDMGVEVPFEEDVYKRQVCNNITWPGKDVKESAAAVGVLWRWKAYGAAAKNSVAF